MNGTASLSGRWACWAARVSRCSSPSPPLHPPAPRPAESETFELCVRGFGPSAPAAERLRRLVIHWADSGRKSTEGVRIRAFPVQHPAIAEDAVRKSGAMLLVDWPA